MTIATQIARLLKFPSRLENVGIGYVGSLMRDNGRRTLQQASENSQLDSSQFSRFLSRHKDLGLESLNRLARRRLLSVLGKRHRLANGAPWTVSVIVDATLHERSSRHMDNAQRFNHGDGWVIGHQWTNIVLVINGAVIPLAPIPFLTRKTCREMKAQYKTEHDRIIDYLCEVKWEEILPGVDPGEIAVLSDSGYDNKKLQRFILSRGWDLVGSLKKSRGVKTQTQGWQSVWDLFNRTRKIGPWQTIRHQADGRKRRREARIRTLTGFLKGVTREMRLVAVAKPNGERLYLACSQAKIHPGAIARAYRGRWRVEIFHKDVKSHLGFEDVGVASFQAVHAHVLWVYCVYLLLYALVDEEGLGVLERRRRIERRFKNEDIGRILKANGRFDSARAVRNHCLQVRQNLRAS